MSHHEDQENRPHFSSPSSSFPGSGSRGRKPPSVTPRRFGRFFTPRSSRPSGSRSGRELRDITQNGSNRAVAPLKFEDVDARPSKRRRTSPEPFQSSPPDANEQLLSSPCQHTFRDEDEHEEQQECKRYSVEEEVHYPTPIQRAKTRHVYSSHPHKCARYTSRTTPYQYDAQCDHQFISYQDPTHTAVPFCVAPTHHSTLIAAGADDGCVRILDTAHSTPHFHTPYFTIHPHANATMDLAFSPDDGLLATAGGDQKVCITDMKTQETLVRLEEHSSSMKQVVWMPRSNHTLASSARDGLICIWDIRAPATLPVRTWRHDMNATTSEMRRLRPTRSFVPFLPPSSERTSALEPPTPSSSPRSLLPSITALTFLPSHPSMFVTATDSTAHLSLWDVRMPVRRTHSTRSLTSSTVCTSPVATTEPPSTHARRSWGVSALAVSASANRLFAVGKDSNVYAYSTSHLALGSVPSYNSFASSLRRRQHTERKGASPLYALRHPKLRCGSFYIRATVDHDGENLAVGSSDSCAVVFPTHEGDARQETAQLEQVDDEEAKGMRIYTAGAALEDGHAPDREVTAVCFARGVERYWEKPTETSEVDEGEDEDERGECERMEEAYATPLVTLGDDCVGRLWRRRRLQERSKNGLAEDE